MANTNESFMWKYIEHFNNVWRIPNEWNEKLIFTNSGINFEAIPNYLNITLMKNDETEDDYDEKENDSIS
uniref:Uncharacterized protein n=1 Tax=viral metagenome TaxID=1070528 RepID=A0A6C0JJG5_9ZZZZ